MKQIQFPQLIEEMRWVAKKRHAQVVFRKCLMAKKYSLAMRISMKYDLHDTGTYSDALMASALCLMAQKTA